MKGRAVGRGRGKLAERRPTVKRCDRAASRARREGDFGAVRGQAAGMRHTLGVVGVMLGLAGLMGCPGGDDGTGETTGIGTTTMSPPPTTTFIETSTGVVEDGGSSGPA